MDRPPPSKRPHSESEDDDEMLSFFTETPPLPFPFLNSHRSSMPDFQSGLFDSKILKHRKISESFQMGSIFPTQQTSLLSSVKNFLKCLETDEVLSALSILSSELAIAQEPVLLSIPMGKVLEGLMKCLVSQVSDVVLLSMNSLLTLIEVASNYAPLLASIGAVPILISKVSNFAYIDVAEQAIKILEKISKNDPTTILSRGVFQITMETLDFYEIQTQKNILNIGINCLSAFGKADNDRSMDRVFQRVITYISSPLQGKVLEFLDLFFAKTCYNSELINIINDQGLISTLNQLFSEANPSTSRLFSMYKNLVKLDPSFISQIFVLNNRQLIETVLVQGSNTETAEILQIFKNSLENPRLHLEDFKELLVWIADLSIGKASVLFYKLLEINEQGILLRIIEGLIKVLPGPEVIDYARDKKFSGLLAETLGRNDFVSIKACIGIVFELIGKVPEEIVAMYIKEGIFSRVKCFKLVGEVNKLEKPSAKTGGLQDFPAFPMFSYRKLEKSAEGNKVHTENVRKLVKTVKEILVKCKKFEKLVEKRIFTVKKIINNLTSSIDSEKSLIQLLDLLQSENGLTTFEFTNENLGFILSNYFKQQNPMKLFDILIQNNEKSFSNFENLVKILTESVQFLQNITSHSSQSRKTLVALQLEYTISDDPTVIPYIHPVFSSSPHFSFPISQCALIENLKNSLLAVNSEQDLIILKESQKFGSGLGLMDYFQDFLEENYRKSHLKPNSLHVKIVANGVELHNLMTVQELLNMYPNLLGTPIKFMFFYKDLSSVVSEFVENPIENIGKIVKICEETGVSPSHSLHPYLFLLKFLFFSNSHVLPSLCTLPFPPILFSCPKFSSILQSPSPDKLFSSLSANCNFLFTYPSRFKHFLTYPCLSKRHLTQKASISRGNLLKSAMRIMSELQSGLLEVDFEGELGTGQGPTLEFYNLTSEKIVSLEIWLNTSLGLFPHPRLECGLCKSDQNLLKFIGQFIGKAIVDRRVIGVELSPVLWKLIFGKVLLANDLTEIFPDISASISTIQSLPSDMIQNLELYFTLPGYDIELLPKGSNIKVISANLSDYISLVQKGFLLAYKSASALREGLSSVISLNDLEVFRPEEMTLLLCGEDFEQWSSDLLIKSIVPAHGFTSASSTYLNLLDILCGFSNKDQQAFLKFVTGCPRLPHGGISALSPKLTVVKKEDSTDQHLPSVMTCQNYLKLPDYSTIELLRQNLYYAMKECAQTFYLS